MKIYSIKVPDKCELEDCNGTCIEWCECIIDPLQQAKPLADRTHWFKQMENQLGLPEDKNIEAVYIQFRENL
jgi:hypothetical protein